MSRRVGIPGLILYPPPALTPSGDHQNMCSWQAGGAHPTGMLSCLTMYLDLLSLLRVFGSLHSFCCWNMLLIRVFHDKGRIYIDIFVI